MGIHNPEHRKYGKRILHPLALAAALFAPASQAAKAETPKQTEAASYSLYRFEEIRENQIFITQGRFGSLAPYICDAERLICVPRNKAIIHAPVTRERNLITVSKSEIDKNTRIIFYDGEMNNKPLSYETQDIVTKPIYAKDGKSFAYYVPAITNETDTKKFVLLHLQDGGIHRSEFSYTIPQKWEMLLEANRLHSFSPDGTRYAFIEDSDDFPRPRIARTAEGLDHSVDIGWPDLGVVADVLFTSNDTLLLQANSKSRPYDWSVYQFNIENGTHAEVVKDISILDEIKILQDGRVLVPVMEGPNMKPVVYDPASKAVSSFAGLEWTKSPYRHRRHTLAFSNGSHGVAVEPEKNLAKNAPLVVWLHGGPWRQASKGFHAYPSYATYDWMLDDVAAEGARVLKLDYPGSYGYGNSYIYSLGGHNGVLDMESAIEDIREYKKNLHLQGETYVIGNSYGGYLAAKLMVEHPREIRSAVPINGVYEWRTLLSYLHDSIFNVQFGGLYDPDKPKNYEQASITNNLDKLTRLNRVAVVVSTADETINPDQSYTFFKLLKSKKIDATLTLLRKENHILKQKSSNETVCRTVFEVIFGHTHDQYCKL